MKLSSSVRHTGGLLSGFAVMVLLAAGALFHPQQLRAEYLFLKDGKIIEGKITSDAQDAIVIVNASGKTESVLRAKVIRIMYTNIYLGKVFVRMTDGKVLEGYQVDEDQDSYIMRKDLNSPVEFKIARKKVMFIARSNPTDLTGVTGQSWAKLKWSPPFVPAKSYKIFVKKNREKEFKFDGAVTKLEYRVDGLSSSTKYSFYVTAIDAESKESLPTDVLELITANSPPDMQGRVSGEAVVTRNGTAMKKDLKLSWSDAKDVDGSVKEYRVYIKEPLSGYKQVWKGSKTSCSFTVPDGYNVEMVNSVKVTAVDDRGAESDGAFYPDPGFSAEKHPYISINMVYVSPFGDLAKVASAGYGVMAQYSMNNWPRQNVITGVETGFIHWSKAGTTSQMYSIPVSGVIAYQLYFTSSIFFEPQLNVGIEYISASYGTVYHGAKSSHGYDPRIGASIAAVYRSDSGLSVKLAGIYAMLYESKSLKQYAGVSMGLGYYY